MTHDTDIGFSGANYYMASFDRVFGEVLNRINPDIAPMEDLTDAEQKQAHLLGEIPTPQLNAQMEKNDGS